jgi:hypothetical protein
LSCYARYYMGEERANLANRKGLLCGIGKSGICQ